MPSAVRPTRKAHEGSAESGRPDDNPETFKTRLNAYLTQTKPLLAYYEEQGKVAEVDGMASMDEVAAQIARALDGSPAAARAEA